MLLEQGGYILQPASLVFHELSFGIQRLADGRRKERFRSYLLNLLTLPVRPESELAASSQQILASRPYLERNKSW